MPLERRFSPKTDDKLSSFLWWGRFGPTDWAQLHLERCRPARGPEPAGAQTERATPCLGQHGALLRLLLSPPKL